ncbi:D-alanyl-D-alanine carboxypeptidase family protein [Aliibacillus thermotolerans]|uniref:serine-type D-Ala-D-Ala carboxypeptidase n=1 Tax=Aliibacillus thermotolerans TaxID=1834418 RepID=A0ABW0U771_9BACI|nr:D-alanyl-D-alanine carboxypeptidase family protein [Aliibacillus thermotolerans]MDA3128648.1 D-alanyl-D-alanine carboxypeptidase [Aliibacillus thermotolerans]
MKSLSLSFFIAILIFVCSTPSLQAEEKEINVSGRSAVLIEQESGRVLFGKEEHVKRKIASITKVMTAILAIESGKLDEYTTVSYEASGVEGSSLYLKPGEKILLRDLVYGLMLRSGNDAAVAIAEAVGGSVDGFVYLMNEKAKEIGMKNTQFTNPHGLDDGDKHYSTAYDMALLTQYAMRDDTFREISGTTYYESPQEGESWNRQWRNKNKLLTSLYEYCTGGKTGYTKSAGRTLITTAEKEGMSLIAVTLDAPSDWNDHIRLFEWGFSTFEIYELTKKNEKLTNKQLHHRLDGTLFLQEAFHYPLKENETERLRRKIIMKERMEQKKQIAPVGEMKWYIGDEWIGTQTIYLERDTTKKQSLVHTWFEWFQRLLGRG